MVSAGIFSMEMFCAAVEAERQSHGLTWQQLAEEVSGPFRGNYLDPDHSSNDANDGDQELRNQCGGAPVVTLDEPHA